MSASHRIRLTSAQLSALECAGLEWGDPDDLREVAVRAAWQGNHLIVGLEARDLVVGGLIDLANSEDAVAEDRDRDVAERRGARGACEALSNLARKV